jgi:hypothetical protein
MTFAEDTFTFLDILGTVSGDDGPEEAIMIGPPSKTVGISLPSGEQKKKDT